MTAPRAAASAPARRPPCAARRCDRYAGVMLTDRAGLTPAELAELAAIVADHRILAHVVRWCAARGQPIVDVVTQDEYTHDVVVPYGARWLVYDTT